MRLGRIAIAATSLLLAACVGSPVQPVAKLGSPLPSASSVPTPAATPAATPTAILVATPVVAAAPTPSPNPCTVPQPLFDICVGRAATSQEEQGMVAAGRVGAEAALHLKDWSQCSSGENCFKVSNPSAAMVGTNAGAFDGSYGQYPLDNLGAFCVVFVSFDSGGWHYVNVTCAQNPGHMPGQEDYVQVSSGCANVRTSPGLTSTVVACLANNTRVSVDSAPVFADGHVWWHLSGRGWMAHDYLVPPNA